MLDNQNNNNIHQLQPPIQAEIISRWVNPTHCKVSVCMLTYNHEEFISEAINSILNQETDFAFELLVHDDASADSTQQIIKKYAEQYPEIIKPIYQTENQHSQRINPSIHYNYPRAKGEYIALCEGDDYWSSPFKLKTQVELLDKNKNINLCFHLAEQISYFNEARTKKTIGLYSDKDCLVPFEKILFLTNGMVPTASCMIRTHIRDDIISFMKQRPHLTLGDRFLQFFGSYPNGAYYINQTMSTYRLGTPHSWSASIAKNTEHKIRHEKVMLLAFTELNKHVKLELSSQISIIYLQRLLWFFNPPKTPIRPLAPGILDNPPMHHLPQQDPGIDTLRSKFTAVHEKILETLKSWNSFSGKKIVYGAGSGCELVVNMIGSLNISAVIDRDQKRTGETFNTIPIISVNDLHLHPEASILVSVPSSQKHELNIELIKNGAKEEKIHYLFEPSLAWLNENLLDENELKVIYESIYLHERTY